MYVCKVNEKQKYRTITFYKDYFQTFFDKQNKKVKAKIVWTFDLVEDLERVPETYLKHIENTDGLYEIRVQLGSDIFRIFCFFDKGQLVVLANGFQKKTQKTPKKEIEMAIVKSDVGMAPINDGKVIRLKVPDLTEERRKDLVKMAKKYTEEAKVAVRNVRRDINDVLKKQQTAKEISDDDLHKGQEEVQKVTDGFIKKADAVLAEKEKEIMEI